MEGQWRRITARRQVPEAGTTTMCLSLTVGKQQTVISNKILNETTSGTNWPTVDITVQQPVQLLQPPQEALRPPFRFLMSTVTQSRILTITALLTIQAEWARREEEEEERRERM